MPLAIFDLDNTLIAGDSDYLWGEHLADLGVVDRAAYRAANERFYADYLEGSLDIQAFLAFSLAPLRDNALEDLLRWRDAFMAQRIEPILLEAADRLITHHRDAGDTLMIITATNAFVTAPIAERLGITHLIATEPEMIDGRYTGAHVGVPSFQQGKVERLAQWLADRDLDLEASSFYSDSINDLPLLEEVKHPHAVDPDPRLSQLARERGWPILTLRDQSVQ